MQVVKRDGSREGFDGKRIEKALEKAFRSVGDEGAEDESSRIALKVSEEILKQARDFIGVEEIQDMVEDALFYEGHLKVLKSYIKYRYKRALSREKFAERQSALMKKIESIGGKDADGCDIKRENANINGDTAMGIMLQYGSVVSKEYCLSYVLDPVYAKAHNEGDIHIHDLDFYSSGGTTTCTQIDLEKLFKRGFSTGHGHLREPQSIASYAALAAIAIQSNQNDQHGGQSIPCFDYYMAPGVLKTFKREFKQMVYDFCVLEGIEKDVDIRGVLDFIDGVGSIDILDEDIEGAKLDDGIPKDLIYKARDIALKKTDRGVYQAMEALIHNLNTMHSRAGAQVPFSSINFGTDTSSEGRMVSKNFLKALGAGMGHGETAIFPVAIFKVKEGVNYNKGDRNYDLFKLACEVSAKRMYPNFAFIDAPFNISFYKEGRPDTEVAYMGCRTRVMSNVNGESVVTGRGNLSFTSINLPRIGIKHRGDLEGFFFELGEKMDLVKGQLLERYRMQCGKRVKNFPFLMGQGVWVGSEGLESEDTLEGVLKHGTLSIGFIGLAEALVALIGEHHGCSDKAQELGLKIIGFMRDKTDEYTRDLGLNFTLLGTPAESLSGRFVKMDRERFGVIKGVTNRDYYTNSFHVPVYFNISVYDKIKKEAPYHGLTNAGHITYVELDGDTAENVEAFEAVIREMKEAGLGYGSINHPVDYDPVCGYTGVIGDRCPLCGRDEDSGGSFVRIRRITGYLVGSVERFCDAKRAEERDRVKHKIERSFE